MVPNGDGLVGREFGGYVLQRVLGSGGAGTVYLATAAADASRQAAIKVLLPPPQATAADRAEFQARFQREAKALQLLQHPHILSLLAYGEHAETQHSYMVLPYMSGGTLAERVAQGPLPLADAQRYAAQIAEALDYAHSRGIVHRDIKPGNVLLDEHGEVFLADFGIAKIFDTAGTTMLTITNTGQVMGTADYMSPEQAQGEHVGPASDVYSLGMVLYHMTTGRVPFEGKSLTQVLLQITQAPPPPPRQFRPDLPPPAEAAILRALAKKPAERFATPGELSNAFALGLRGEWLPGLRQAVTVDTFVPQPTVAAPPVTSPPRAAPVEPMPVPPMAAPPGYGAPGYAPQYVPQYMPLAPVPPPQQSQRPGRRWSVLVLAGLAALVIVTVSGVLLAGGDILSLIHGTGASATATSTSPSTFVTGISSPTASPGSTAPATNTPNGPSSATPTFTTPSRPATGTVTEFGTPTGGSHPRGITAGPDGALWFTEWGGNNIGRITTGGRFTEYPIPTAACAPAGITSGPDGALWFTEFSNSANKIGRITTGGTISEFTIPTGASEPAEITPGSDGALWFTEFIGSKIGRITTSGSITEFTIPTASSYPVGIASGPDGALWFTENGGNKIGRITTSGSFSEFVVPSATRFGSITAGPDGAMWFAEYDASKIGRITTGGNISEFPIPTTNGNPTGITAGPDGALWFTEISASKIGRVTPGGNIRDFPTRTGNSQPYYISSGSDGNLWFAEYNASRIARITT